MSGLDRHKLLGFQLLLTLVTALGQQMTVKLVDATLLCADDNTPVCASSRGEYMLFKNECQLRRRQRVALDTNERLVDVALYNCLPKCDFECEKALVPICGVRVASNARRTFRNRCEMMRTACNSKSDWLLYKWGVCPRADKQLSQTAHTVRATERKTRQTQPCTNEYQPVCASYAGVKSTFTNKCLVKAENMRAKRNWRIISEGICGEDSAKMNRKYVPKSQPKVQIERSKRSHGQLNELDDFELSEDAVEIFAPSTFYTQFISNSGTIEKSYSLPARVPEQATRLASRRSYSSTTEASQTRHCVFSNQPVCGSFNGESRTFPNVCALMQYSQAVGSAWTILYEGACRRCDKSCPTVLSPVCATRNGINYTIINECYLERVRCKDPNSDWKIAHMGECVQLSDELSQRTPPPSQKYPSGISDLLYASKQNRMDIHSLGMTTPNSASMTASTAPAVPTTVKPSHQLSKSKSPIVSQKDLNYSKSLQTEHKFKSNLSKKEAQGFKVPATFKFGSTNDQFNRKVNSKRASVTAEAAGTTSSTVTPPDSLDLRVAELLNLNIAEESKKDTDELKSHATATARTIADSSELQIAKKPSFTQDFPSSNTTIANVATIHFENVKNASFTTDSEESTLPTTINKLTSSSESPTLSTKRSTESATAASAEEDDNRTKRFSIFSSDKNSLIMRLLGTKSLLSIGI